MIAPRTVSWVTPGLRFRSGDGHHSSADAARAFGDTGANNLPKIQAHFLCVPQCQTEPMLRMAWPRSCSGHACRPVGRIKAHQEGDIGC